MLQKGHIISTLATAALVNAWSVDCPAIAEPLYAGSDLIAQSPYVQTYTPGKAAVQKNKPAGTTTDTSKAKTDDKTATDKTSTDKTATDKSSTDKGTTAGDKGKASTDKTATATTDTGEKKAKRVVIIKPKTHTVTNDKSWQQVGDYIILKPGQESFPLTLTITNGPDGATPVVGLRTSLAGRDILTEKSFKGKSKLDLDMTNALSAGSTQILFRMYGPKGSAFSWQLTTKQGPSVTKLLSDKSSPGKKVKAEGVFLPKESSAYKITVENKSSSVTPINEKQIEFVVPKDVKPDKKGEVTVVITVSGYKSAPLKLKIQEPPEISMFSHVAINNQTTLTITGKNFSDKTDKVRVLFGSDPGEVVSVTETQIQVRPPAVESYPAIVPVTVEVDGLKCHRQGVIQINQFNVSNDNSESPFDVGSTYQ